MFIRLYLDEDVDIRAAEMLRARGFDVLTTRDAGHLRFDDASQLSFAANNGRALVTHNRVDFERLAQDYFAAGQTHSGIIIAVRRPVSELVRRLLVVLNQLTADEMTNQIRYI